jgi:hypothetical protein
MRWTCFLGCLVVAGLVACGDDATVKDSSSSAGGAGGAGGMAQGGGGSGAGATCADVWLDGIIELDPTGPDTQIHGSSTFDGNHLWMAWSRPDSGSLFDIFLASFACDGSVVTSPFEVTQTDDNELDPVLSVSGDRLLVAWLSDNGTGIDNLDIRYRVFTLDGAAVSDSIELSATRNGVAVTGNALYPSLASIDGGWMLAGSWGHADAPGFQAFAVELDLDGVVQGDAQDAELDVTFGQTSTSVAVDAAGVHVVWQEDSVTSMAPSSWATTLGGTPSLLGDPGARPHVAPGPWTVWDTDGTDIVLQAPGGSATSFGLSGFVHSARVVALGGEATVLWMQVASGIQNRVFVAPIGSDGTVGATVSLATDQAPSVYPLDLTMIDSTHAVVVYQDGATPDFRAKAEYITLVR